jgi:DNA-binding FrmR family transcriptional regulator
MTHTISDKKKLLNRVRRIHGQLHAVEKALGEEKDPCSVLQTLVAAHGAMKSLMSEIIEGHVRFHVLDAKHKPTKEQTEATEQLIEVVKTYLR